MEWDSGKRKFIYTAATTLGSSIQAARTRSRTRTEFEFKRRRLFDETNMNEFSRSRKYRKLGRYKLNKQLYPATTAVEDRFQGLTNFDVNAGYARLSQYDQSGFPEKLLPIMMFDLTSFPSTTAPEVARTLGWTNTTTTADINLTAVVGQTPTGAAGTGNFYWQRTSGKGAPLGATPRVFLKWVKLSFNLYGARKRTTTFKLHIVQFPTLNRNMFENPTAKEAKDILQYLERPLIFNNLQTDSSNTIRKMKILSTYKWVVQPQQTTDLNTTTGKIKEANVFLRMNKCLNLDWTDDGVHEPHAVPSGENNDGIDYEVRDYAYKTGPNYASRVYAILTAFSPENRSLPAVNSAYLTPSQAFAFGGGAVGSAVDSAIEPSVDFLIRRGYTTET